MAADDTTKALTALRKALKQMGGAEGLKAIKAANVEIAGVVLDKAKPGIAGVSSTVAASAVVVKSTVAPAIRVTSVRAGGTIFGAYQNKPRTGPSGRKYLGYNQFRNFKPDAYHIIPEAQTVDEQIVTEYAKAVDVIMDNAGVPRG